MRGKEEAAAGKKRAQAATDELLTPCSKKSSLKVSQKKQDPKNWMQRQRLIFMKMALLSSIQLLPQVLLS
jgi:hypothetical protein